MTATQATLPLKLSDRTVLVTVDMARGVAGYDAESITGMIESGELQWAWDISTKPAEGIREIRIWARSLVAGPCDLAEDEVINAVIGTDLPSLRAVRVGHILMCSRPQILRLVRSGHLAGPLVGHTQFIYRDTLVHFLKNRRIL